MLRFEQFWQGGQLLIRGWTCFSGRRLADTEADGHNMYACIDKYFDDTPVTAIS
jgi:hypothetical protein